jgi:hypothetical protein
VRRFKLGEAYNGLGDVKKISIFPKANQLLKNKIKMNKFFSITGVCSSRFVQVESHCDRSTVPVTYLKSSKIIANHYNNKSDFPHYI